MHIVKRKKNENSNKWIRREKKIQIILIYGEKYLILLKIQIYFMRVCIINHNFNFSTTYYYYYYVYTLYSRCISSVSMVICLRDANIYISNKIYRTSIKANKICVLYSQIFYL